MSERNSDEVAGTLNGDYLSRLVREIEHYKETNAGLYQQFVELQMQLKETQRDLAILRGRIAVGELEVIEPPKGAFQSVKQRAPVGQAYNGPPGGLGASPVFERKILEQVMKEAAVMGILKKPGEDKGDRVELPRFPFMPMKK